MTIKVKQPVLFRDLGKMPYRQAWDYQEKLLQENVRVKAEVRSRMSVRMDSFGEVGIVAVEPQTADHKPQTQNSEPDTQHYLLFVEHPPVYTLGKSGSLDNLLIGEKDLQGQGIEFFHTNRGGDITFHGTEQIVGYPILDLEKFYTDIGKYLRNLEEVIIKTMDDYGLQGERSQGETGVWIDTQAPGKARKICAMGIRCSRWITMHGFAFNVNTDLSYFNNIIPCGIRNKQVTSLQKELGRELSMEEVKQKIKRNFEEVFEVELV